jgi:hypothetical protein
MVWLKELSGWHYSTPWVEKYTFEKNAFGKYVNLIRICISILV